MNRDNFWPGFAFGCLVAFVVCGMFSGSNVQSIRREAARANAGRWIVDSTNGVTTWEWTGRKDMQ